MKRITLAFSIVALLGACNKDGLDVIVPGEPVDYSLEKLVFFDPHSEPNVDGIFNAINYVSLDEDSNYHSAGIAFAYAVDSTFLGLDSTEKSVFVDFGTIGVEGQELVPNDNRLFGYTWTEKDPDGIGFQTDAVWTLGRVEDTTFTVINFRGHPSVPVAEVPDFISLTEPFVITIPNAVGAASHISLLVEGNIGQYYVEMENPQTAGISFELSADTLNAITTGRVNVFVSAWKTSQNETLIPFDKTIVMRNQSTFFDWATK